MFELLKEIEKMRVGGRTPAQVAQAVQTPADTGLQLTQHLRKTAQDAQLTQTCAAAAQATDRTTTGLAQVTQLAQGSGAEIIKWPHPGKPLPRSRLWSFLTPCPLTRTMLEKATELWQEPLDQRDWCDIQSGIYLFENKEFALREYLVQWADEHPDRMRQLKEGARP